MMDTGIPPFPGVGQVPGLILPTVILGDGTSWLLLLASVALASLLIWRAQISPSFHYWGDKLIHQWGGRLIHHRARA